MTIPQQIKELMVRRRMSITECAMYLGVPVPTLRKWISGERSPAAVVGRLIEVLQIFETLCPEVHNAFVGSLSDT